MGAVPSTSESGEEGTAAAVPPVAAGGGGGGRASSPFDTRDARKERGQCFGFFDDSEPPQIPMPPELESSDESDEESKQFRPPPDLDDSDTDTADTSDTAATTSTPAPKSASATGRSRASKGAGVNGAGASPSGAKKARRVPKRKAAAASARQPKRGTAVARDFIGSGTPAATPASTVHATPTPALTVSPATAVAATAVPSAAAAARAPSPTPPAAVAAAANPWPPSSSARAKPSSPPPILFSPTARRVSPTSASATSSAPFPSSSGGSSPSGARSPTINFGPAATRAAAGSFSLRPSASPVLAPSSPGAAATSSPPPAALALGGGESPSPRATEAKAAAAAVAPSTPSATASSSSSSSSSSAPASSSSLPSTASPPSAPASSAASEPAAPLSIGSLPRREADGADLKQCWSPAEASRFRVRLGPDYAKTSTKAPSLDSIYDCIGIDVFQGCQHNVGAAMTFPHIPPITDPVRLPGILILNVLLCEPYLQTVAFYFSLSPATRALVAAYKEARAAGTPPQLTPSYPPSIDCQMNALYLFERYIANSPHDKDIRKRLKCIITLSNSDDVDFGWLERRMINSNNGTPFMLTESPSFHVGPNYFEVDVDTAKFRMISRQGLGSVQNRISKMMLNYSWTIQGDTDAELPERILGCASVNLVDLSIAQRKFTPASSSSSSRSK